MTLQVQRSLLSSSNEWVVYGFSLKMLHRADSAYGQRDTLFLCSFKILHVISYKKTALFLKAIHESSLLHS